MGVNIFRYYFIVATVVVPQFLSALSIPFDSINQNNTVRHTLYPFVKQHFFFGRDKFSFLPYMGNTDYAELPIGVVSKTILFARGQKTKSGLKIFSYSIQDNAKTIGIAVSSNLTNILSANSFPKLFLTVNDSNQLQLLASEEQPQHLRCIYKTPHNVHEAKKGDVINEFEFNSNKFNVLHAAANTTRTRIIFASNMPGGYGGYDLYITFKKDSSYSIPVNLGNKVNTTGDELFPTILNDTRFFFSSNGYSGNNFDIYTNSLLHHTTLKSTPVEGLDTEYNELALVTNSQFTWGAFASDSPSESYDYNVYNFVKEIKDASKRYKELFEAADYSEMPSPNCVSLDLSKSIDVNGADYRYLWDMGDGGTAEGVKIEYCYKKAGAYTAVLKTASKEFVGIVDTALQVPVTIKDVLKLNIMSVDTTSIQESVEFIATHNWPDSEAKLVEAIWKTDDKQYYSGTSTGITFATRGWHKVELLANMEIDGKQRIMYHSRKIYLSK